MSSQTTPKVAPVSITDELGIDGGGMEGGVSVILES